MPKRHRQPEPIDIESTFRHRSNHECYDKRLLSSDASLKNPTALRASSAAATCAAAGTERADSVYSPGEIELAEKTRKRAKDLPATPESLVRHRRQLKAHAKRRRISFDKDGQPVDDDNVSGEAALRAQQRRPVLLPVKVSFPSLPGRASSAASNGLDLASHDEGKDDDDDIDFSSNDYVGDDGNQPSSDDSALGGESDGDSAAEEEEELRQLRNNEEDKVPDDSSPLGSSDDGLGDSSGMDEEGELSHDFPFTSVVRLQNNGEDTTGEEEQEFYGLSSVLDVAHGQSLYPAALRPLCGLLQQRVWRQAAPGIPPTDILTSVVDGGPAVSSRAKCLLLISEYIRNIPLELTVQILEDVLDRLDAAGQQEKKKIQVQTAGEAMATHEHPIFATHPSMLAVLAKVQRATDAPVTLPKHAVPFSSGGGSEGAGSGGDAAAAAHRKHHNGGSRNTKKGSDGASGSVSGGAMGAPNSPLDLTHYIFWREEDNILYEFRDKRVATLVYRCRPQYDGQPAHEIPLSILFVLQYGAARQAVDEMRRRQTVNAAVERY
ncbi:p21-C-terminal region-binding family protein [Leishmania donovani]|uniref:p21-C-terminal region-binding family protein n=1 Tax=Leishmania donovani TaxID=5661 RepID=A0A504XYV0_LEIDO|nr:p21-C-terminal region-binding family protein [Leishmania donovani]